MLQSGTWRSIDRLHSSTPFLSTQSSQLAAMSAVLMHRSEGGFLFSVPLSNDKQLPTLLQTIGLFMLACISIIIGELIVIKVRDSLKGKFAKNPVAKATPAADADDETVSYESDDPSNNDSHHTRRRPRPVPSHPPSIWIDQVGDSFHLDRQCPRLRFLPALVEPCTVCLKTNSTYWRGLSLYLTSRGKKYHHAGCIHVVAKDSRKAARRMKDNVTYLARCNCVIEY